MAMSVTYTTFMGDLVAENRSGIQSYYVGDGLGSTSALIDSTGAITDTWTYWPYGEVKSRTGTTSTPFTFAGTLGYFQDLLNKFTYVRARFLRVALGNWQTLDPIWPLMPPYAYAGSSPLDFVDPLGQTPSRPCLGEASTIPSPESCRSTASHFRKCQDLLEAQMRARASSGMQQICGGYQDICESCAQATGLRIDCGNQGARDIGSGAGGPMGSLPWGGLLGVAGTLADGWTIYGNSMNFKRTACMAACRGVMRRIRMYPNWGKQTCEGFCDSAETGGCGKLFNLCGDQQGHFQKTLCVVFYNIACPGE